MSFRLLKWMPRRRARVYHPEGIFDNNVLVGEIEKVEREGFRPTAIVMTRAQKNQCTAHAAMRVAMGDGHALFGLPIEIDDTPRGCVGVEEEW